MCDLSDGFRLCTCDGESEAEPDWVLERLDASKRPMARRGRVVMPRYSKHERSQRTRIIEALNEGTCFDFDYAPTVNDVLTLKASGRVFRFRFRKGRWTFDRSNHLTAWRTQMVRLDQGKVS